MFYEVKYESILTDCKIVWDIKRWIDNDDWKHEMNDDSMRNLMNDSMNDLMKYFMNYSMNETL